MVDRFLLVEERLTTAQFCYPFRAGWLEPGGVLLQTRVSAPDVAEWPVALLDSVEARALIRSHVIVREAAICFRRATMLTLATHTRPDEIAQATVSLSAVSAAGRAVAAIVVPSFYGIVVTNWTTERLPVDASTVLVSEDETALIPFEDEESYQEDLGRAWFLFTDVPFVSHVCMARRDLLANSPHVISAALSRLHEARDLARTRGRELRRDLSRDLNVEREVLTDALADQSLTLGNDEQIGLEELWKRAGTPLSASEHRGAFVSFRGR